MAEAASYSPVAISPFYIVVEFLTGHGATQIKMTFQPPWQWVWPCDQFLPSGI